MATIDRYKIKIEVDGKEQIVNTEQALDNLTQKVSNFAKVGVAAFGALTVSAARMADQMVDLAGTAGMSAGKIYQMSVAAQAAGGDFDQVGGMLLKFSGAVDDAVRGNDKLRDSFAQIGVSTRDLETLSDEQLFQAVVTGLGNMEDGAQKTALAVELLGKKAATTNLQQFARDISTAVDPNVEKTLLSAAKAVDSIEKAFRSLQLAALQAMQPILEIIGEFNFDVEAAQKTLQVFGALIAAAFAASTVAAIAKVVETMRILAQTIRAAATAQALLTGLIPGIGAVQVVAAIAGATAAYVALGAAIGDATKAQDELIQGVDASSGTVISGTVQRDTDSTVRDLELSARQRAAEAAKRTTDQIRLQNDLSISLRKTILEVSNIERNRAQQLIANNQAYNELLITQAELKAQIAEEENKGIQANQELITELNTRLGIAEDLFNRTVELNKAEYERLNTIRLQNEARKDQLSLIERAFTGAQETARINTMMLQAQGMGSRERLRLLDEEIEKNRFIQRILTIEADIKAAQTVEEIRDLRRLLTEEEARHTTAMNNIAAEQIAIDKLNNSTIAGVISAMERIQQQFTPYNMAQDAILKGWDTIGKAVDNFTRTGKFKFKDFALSAIADITSMVLKAQLLKGITGGLGLFGINIPGLATGGPAQAGKPYIVGEKGPELFIPKSAGTVIPNNAMASTSAAPMQQPQINNTYVTNNINAVDAKSVAQLFVENRKTLLGATMMARKEMPYGMG